jgi:iron complex outermembrane receptor protein
MKKNIELNINSEYNSMRYSTSYGSSANAFLLFNFFTSYKIKQFTLYSGVKNIFDKKYEYQEGYPGPGRNVFIRLLFEWN